jgi:hypothetical protein
MEIDQIIKEIKAKHDEFNSGFGGLLNNNDYLGGLLDNMNSQNIAEINKIMSFINFSYSVDIRTGEINGSFDFGVMGLNDDIWGRITANMEQRAGKITPWKVGGTVFSFFIEYAGAKLVDLFIDDLRNNFNRAFQQLQIDNRIPFRTDTKIFISDFNRSVNAYVNDKKNPLSEESARLKVLGDYEASTIIADRNYESARSNYNNANIAIGVAKRALDDAKAKLKEYKEEFDKNHNQRNYAYRDWLDAKTDEERADAQFALDVLIEDAAKIKKSIEEAKKDVKEKEEKVKKAESTAAKKKDVADEAEAKANKAKADEDQADETVNPQPKKSCVLMSGTGDECNAGVSPSGMAVIMNSTPIKLLQEIDSKIRNIPQRECNIVTRSCGNSIEPTAEEMKQLFDNINADSISDDGGCIWGGEEGCSIFGGAESSGISYINKLWGPLPEMGE